MDDYCHCGGALTISGHCDNPKCDNYWLDAYHEDEARRSFEREDEF